MVVRWKKFWFLDPLKRLFSHFLCNFQNKKTVNTQDWQEQKQKFNQEAFQIRFIEASN